MAGCRSLKAVEELTDELTLPVRRKLGIGHRIPDTHAARHALDCGRFAPAPA